MAVYKCTMAAKISEQELMSLDGDQRRIQPFKINGCYLYKRLAESEVTYLKAVEAWNNIEPDSAEGLLIMQV